MSTVFNSSAFNSSGSVTQAQLNTAVNNCVKKSQLTNAGLGSGVAQLTSNGGLVTGAGGITCNGPVSISGTNQLTIGGTINGTSNNLAVAGGLTIANTISQYNSLNVVGNGIPVCVASASLRGLTTNQTILSYTVPSGVTTVSIEIKGNMEVTSYTSGTISLNLTFTKAGSGTSVGPAGIVGSVPGLSAGPTNNLSSLSMLVVAPTMIQTLPGSTVTISTTGTYVLGYNSTILMYSC